MEYFALQVKTRSEELYIQKVQTALPKIENEALRLIFPRKKMSQTKNGKKTTVLLPIFPGYIFIELPKLTDSLYWILRTTPGFYRFLPANSEAKPLSGRDLSILKHFMSFGPIAQASRVLFDENDRIQVIEGPLKGLEGKIVKVDRRKKRAKIQLDMYEESFFVDLAFEIIGRE
ncbi:antiterminator LoaP [Treponema zuelzerae]|uniref:Antiterminator LoaP n=1 Tax=Teretinema zuelzerae TaxID=156 RepID=A0AAE3EHM2_9SPIR|nr:antiterminator LoaP [Teretinema zuelzerae]MBN2810401.1 antiterminator LoaP [Spirochaetales bacterium]MCD1654541.1 antiterminator LoaP [Teretinema zuelzerae]